MGATVALLLVGCSNAESETGTDAEPAVKAPASVVFNDAGQRFDLIGSVKSVAVREFLAGIRIPKTGEAAPEVVLAERMRGHMFRDGYHYFQSEPDIELAKEILNGPSPEATNSSASLEGRDIVGADNRANISNTALSPYRSVVFSESGCSGALIGRQTILTAGHCVYDSDPDEWICEDGSSADSCNLPNYRPGVNDNTGVTNWISGYTVTIPNCFMNRDDSLTGAPRAQCDYAVVDTRSASVTSPGSTASWLGTNPLSNAGIASRMTYRYGYPGRAPCPDNANGDSADCPGAWQYDGSPAPFTGAEQWGMSAVAGSTTASGNDALVTTIDWVGGDSGSPIWINDGDNPQVIGNVSNSPTTGNFAARWTSTTHNFVASNSAFPGDAQ